MSIYILSLGLLWFTGIYFLAVRPIINRSNEIKYKKLREEYRFFKTYMVKRYYSNFEELNIANMDYDEIKALYSIDKSYENIKF